MPTDLSEEDPLPGNAEAHPTVGVFIPAQVRHRRLPVPSLPPLWHMCSRPNEQPDQEQGPSNHILLFILWWVLQSVT